MFSICLISLVASVMLSLYAKLSSHALAIQERESGSKHVRNWVYLSKIENSSYGQEFHFYICLLYDSEMLCSQELDVLWRFTSGEEVRL